MAQHLTRDRQLVLRVERQNLVIEAVRGLEVGEPEGLAVELEAMPEDVERPLDVYVLRERVEEVERLVLLRLLFVRLEIGETRARLGAAFGHVQQGAVGVQVEHGLGRRPTQHRKKCRPSVRQRTDRAR